MKVDLEAVDESWVGGSKVEDSLEISEARSSRIEVVERVPRILTSVEGRTEKEGRLSWPV